MSASEQDLQAIAAEYDSLIRQYEMYYQQQLPANAPTTNAAPLIENSPYLEQLKQNYEQGLAAYEQSLQYLEQVQSDANAALPQLQTVAGQDKEDLVGGWENYLQEALGMAKQLVDSLESSISFAGG